MPPLEFRTITADATSGRFAVTIPADLPYFEGHFPGAPILPAIAQLLVLVLDRTHALWPELGQPRRVARLKFMQKIDPGDELEVHLERTAAEVRFALLRRDEPCTRGVLAFA
jgi:3-hydroxymyristoyl/3-hydroxydecanoyl-(acyl carrier protein) dehydratase